MKGLRIVNAGDAELPTLTDSPAVLTEKNKGVSNVGQLVEHFPSDLLSTRDP
jgi:hypothetical protein